MGAAFVRLCLLSTLLAFSVVALGAFVRLSDAGLSCPDWPGCYGQVLVPSSEAQVADANSAYPQTPVETGKAWKEMVHRYLAGLLGLAIAAIALWSWRRRHTTSGLGWLPFVLLLLVVFQALLGMWTVTLLLKPVIVTAHLLGGMMTLALLWWLTLKSWAQTRDWKPTYAGSAGLLVSVGLVLLILQIALGGWTSANYAALSCPDFPLCNGRGWPEMNLSEGFQIARELGVNESGDPVTREGMVAIHFVHRLGALLAFSWLLAVSLLLALRLPGAPRYAAGFVLAVLCVQVFLGVATVLTARPLGYAVAHNANAALLLLSVLLLFFVTRFGSGADANSGRI